ncbi:MAG: SpoIIE family protein phosphatase [Leptospiraceae bacterium]|nr:SpoIIE family protein phosphatase [Leptospiraceae bacterium]
MNIFQRIWQNIRVENAERKAHLPEYIAELNQAVQPMQKWVGLLAMVAWLGFALDLDPRLHPDVPELLYLRLGLSVTGFVVFVLSLFKATCGRGLGLLYLTYGYVALVTPIITARLANDAAYMSGYMLVLLISVLIPTRFIIILLFNFGSIIVFMLGLLYFKPELGNQADYSFQNLGIAVLVSVVFSYFIDRIRFSAFKARREIEIANDELSRTHKQINVELEMASEIQKGILPGLKRTWHGFEFSAYWAPMARVSGDFYDLIPMPSDTLGILMADVSGHGIPSALVTTMAKISFQENGRESVKLTDLFHRVNEQICNNVPGADYLTAFFVRLSKNGEFVYANASHQKAIVLSRDGSLRSLDTGGLFIGAVPGQASVYEEKNDLLEYGDKLILLTDGIVEARDVAGTEFSEDRLHELLVEYRDRSGRELTELIVNNLKEFTAGTEATDDITIMVVERLREYADFREKFTAAEKIFDAQQYEKSVEMLSDLVQKFPDEEPAKLLLAKSYYRQKKFESAIKLLKEILHHHPDHFDANLMAAVSAYNTGDKRMATGFARAAVSLRKRSARAWYITGLALQSLDRKEALHCLETAVNLAPGNQRFQKALQRIVQ